MIDGKLRRDERGNSIQAYVFEGGQQSGLTMDTDNDDMLIHLGADVDIAKDGGLAVPFNKGDKIILVANSTYTFSADIAIGL